MIVTLAFKSESKNFTSNLGAWLVKAWTRSDYYHVELIINDIWISSSPSSGVHSRPLEPLKDTYVYIDVEVDGRRLSRVNKFIKEQEGKNYDWAGIVWAQVFKITRGEHQSKWFCSEIDAEILKRFGKSEINKKSATYSPGDLYNLFHELPDC